jgi:hypothetical protein
MSRVATRGFHDFSHQSVTRGGKRIVKEALEFGRVFNDLEIAFTQPQPLPDDLNKFFFLHDPPQPLVFSFLTRIPGLSTISLLNRKA